MTKGELTNISEAITILQMTLLHQRRIGVYLPENKICFVDREGGEILLSPIGADTETFDFNPKQEEIYIPLINRSLSGITPHQTLIAPSSDPHQTLIEPSLNPHETLIKSSYLVENGSVINFKEGRNAEPIAHKIDDDVLRKKAFIFENLVLAKLNLEGSMRTYSTAHKNFLKYIEVIADKNPHKLSRLNKLIEEVKSNTAKMKAEKQNYSQSIGKKEGLKSVAKWSFAILFTCLILFGIYKIVFPTISEIPSAKTQTIESKVTSTTRSNTVYRIQQEITDFEKSSGLNISPWREGKLIQEAKDVEMSDFELAKFVREYALKEF